MHAVLIWDGAGFHTGEDVVVPSNVSLIQLPPYSPELNPVENLWHYLRAHHWSNRLYRDYDALQEEAVRSLCAVREDTETIKTVCNPRYISRAHEIAGKRMTCDICHRSYGVYAASLFCPDCGGRNIHVHFRREIQLIGQQIDLARKIGEDGDRKLAYRLLCNAHEDVLTAFEAYHKVIYRFLLKRRLPAEADALARKRRSAIGFRTFRGDGNFTRNSGSTRMHVSAKMTDNSSGLTSKNGMSLGTTWGWSMRNTQRLLRLCTFPENP